MIRIPIKQPDRYMESKAGFCFVADLSFEVWKRNACKLFSRLEMIPAPKKNETCQAPSSTVGTSLLDPSRRRRNEMRNTFQQKIPGLNNQKLGKGKIFEKKRCSSGMQFLKMLMLLSIFQCGNFFR